MPTGKLRTVYLLIAVVACATIIVSKPMAMMIPDDIDFAKAIFVIDPTLELSYANLTVHKLLHTVSVK